MCGPITCAIKVLVILWVLGTLIAACVAVTNSFGGVVQEEARNGLQRLQPIGPETDVVPVLHRVQERAYHLRGHIDKADGEVVPAYETFSGLRQPVSMTVLGEVFTRREAENKEKEIHEAQPHTRTLKSARSYAETALEKWTEDTRNGRSRDRTVPSEETSKSI